MDRKTITAYNAQAEQYDNETKDFWTNFPIGFLEKFSSLAGTNLVDLGCGPGRDAVLLRSLGHNVTCVDASQSMVKLCEQQGFEAICADFLSLPFESDQFNGAWAYTSLLHVPKSQIKTALKEIIRVVKNDGFIGIGMIEGDSEQYVISKKVSLPRFFAYYSPAELEKVFTESGLRVIARDTFQPNQRRYLNYILSTAGSSK